MKRKIAILGSTGSIGVQALEVIRNLPDLLEVEVLTAFNNADSLIQQALEFQPNAVVIVNELWYPKVKEALQNEDIKVFAGESSLIDIVEMDSIDMVLAAIVGVAGLKPVYHAIEYHKPVALANKETLVVAGELMMQKAGENQVPLLPVDSEHSAIFQSLAGEFENKIEKLIITASGGPFRGKTAAELREVTLQQALKHPNWSMGHKITIDSATLMNKGLEVIEAQWLFGVPLEDIEVVVHPQSIIHSLVRFTDGSLKAQLGLPDMKLPIQYALTYPKRVATDFPRFSFAQYPALTFEAPDLQLFPCLQIAKEAAQRGGNIPAAMNAANEVAVAMFLQGKIKFTNIPDLVAKTIAHTPFSIPKTIEGYIETDLNSRIYTNHNSSF
ncbi:MAG: 1-deoxy-D-xylulose-5-phosphate reductoisomerase [Bacteroidales bacterium]|nr:1-deoxy-D-xylulose-5-phosphate reductoisomerase [Bacteroidales bacterium]